jgi:hypothetical protein
MLKLLANSSKEERLPIKLEIRRIIFKLRREQESIMEFAALAQESIINLDLKKFDRYFYYARWESIGEIMRLHDDPLMFYSHFKKNSSGIMVPRTFRDMYWRHFFFRIWRVIRKLF